MIFAWLVPVIALLVLLGVSGKASGYLLVMRSRRHDLVLMERRADARYHLFPLPMLPVVLLRYGALLTAYLLLLLAARAAGWQNPRKPLAVPAKA